MGAGSSGGGEQAGVTHSQVSFLRFPIVDGMVPVRSLLSRRLGMRRRGRKAGSRAQTDMQGAGRAVNKSRAQLARA